MPWQDNFYPQYGRQPQSMGPGQAKAAIRKTCHGMCKRCHLEHALGPGHALELCIQLMDKLTRTRRIDWQESFCTADPRLGSGGMPAGTGDCCAPKLLNYAVRNHLISLGIVEFYWGRESRSGRKQHGRFYAACAEKCQPILGFMLCGLPGI